VGLLDLRVARPLQLDSTMATHARDPQSPKPAEAAAPKAAARTPASPRERALALQRKVGNRAAGRVLARWVKHPDAEQKGVMVPDSSADEFTHFNPPKNE
jgi:hypothetical protein